MSDAATPIIAAALAATQPAPAAQAPAQAAPAAAPPVAPVADAAPAVEAPKVTPPRLNPWAKREASKPAPVASPEAPPAAAAPVVDPRVATLEAQVASMQTLVRTQAEEALASVPENVRAVVASLAGDDPARRLDVLRTLRAQGLATSPAVVPPGATTMPTGAAAPPSPPASTSTATADAAVLAEYERLTSGGSPIVASAFASANRATLARARAAVASRN